MTLTRKLHVRDLALGFSEPGAAQDRAVRAAYAPDAVLHVVHPWNDLANPDEAWSPFWHDDMVWYGPGAFGSFIGIEDFTGFQVPFEGAFSLWSGGAAGNGVTQHFTRYADGEYACVGGWPSLMAVRKDDFLGHPGNGETIFMRVCDWWRRSGEKLIENWVFVDIPDVLLQMGQDLFPGFHTVEPGARKAPS